MTLHSTVTFSITGEAGTEYTGSYTSRNPRAALSWLAELMTGHARQRPTADATATLTDGNPSIDTPAIEWAGTVAEISADIDNHLAADDCGQIGPEWDDPGDEDDDCNQQVPDVECYHPRSCRLCDHLGGACGNHLVGDVGHQRCTGRPAADDAANQQVSGGDDQ